jgi:hypothetical protein
MTTQEAQYAEREGNKGIGIQIRISAENRSEIAPPMH